MQTEVQQIYFTCVILFYLKHSISNKTNLFMFHLYILLSEKTGKFYIGSTGNLEDRLSRHTTGRSKATFTGRPWKLIWTEEFETRSAAYKREMEIKAWKSHDRIVPLVKRIPF